MARGSRVVRIIVLRQMPITERNALWQMFSAIPERVKYGADQYQWHIQDMSTLIEELVRATLFLISVILSVSSVSSVLFFELFYALARVQVLQTESFLRYAAFRQEICQVFHTEFQ